MTERRGVPHFKVKGKGGKIRYVPAHSATLERIQDYLGASGHGDEPNTPPIFGRSKGILQGITTTH